MTSASQPPFETGLHGTKLRSGERPRGVAGVVRRESVCTGALLGAQLQTQT
jgi:hypothetical protein